MLDELKRVRLANVAVGALVVGLLFFACVSCASTGSLDYEKTAQIVEVAAAELEDEAALRDAQEPGSGAKLDEIAAYVRVTASAVRAYGSGSQGEGVDPRVAIQALLDFTEPYLADDDQDIREAVRIVRSAARLALVSLPPPVE